MAATRAFGLARQFSTSASREALAKAPIQVFGIEGRYAHAIYSAATKKNSLDTVEKDFTNIKTLLAKDVKFSEFISNPSIQRVTKREGVVSALTKQKYSDLTINLFGAMAENGRLHKAGAIMKAFDKILAAHKGIVVCTVTTAKPLDASQQKDLQTSLNGFIKKGEKMEMTLEVDPNLIGGMTVSIGDKFIDMSISRKLNMYKNVVLGAAS